ncbi:MAG: hypothetical protein ACKVP0_18930 [Pirellulaceae bacterium]
MIDQGYREFCESLWQDWLKDRIDLGPTLSTEFQLDHAPEPYLCSGEGKSPLYLLLTNPGAGMDHQRRQDVKQVRGCINARMSYAKASAALGEFYYRKAEFRSPAARTRNEAAVDLKRLLGKDCIIQFESIPFHSESLPAKRKLPELIDSSPHLKRYAQLLSATLHGKTVFAISAVDSSKSISASSVANSHWLSWQATSLLGMDLSKLKCQPLAMRDGKVSRAFVFQKVDEHARGFILTMGTNSFPAAKGRGIIARALIAECFNDDFATWKIRLPKNHVKASKAGRISKRGWSIQYLFSPEDCDQPYLDYYASHRMTNDRHVRVFADGKKEYLPVLDDFRFCSDNPKEDAALQKEHQQRTQGVLKVLQEKGFAD